MQTDTTTARQTRFESIYEEHATAVLRYCLRRVRTPALADDACSETFLVAWRRLDEIPPAGARPWLLAVARRVVANLLRGDHRRDALTTRLSIAPTEWDSSEAADDEPLHAALAGLSEPDREALTLVYWDELTTAEAAKAMNTTPTALRVRLYRARRRLELKLNRRPSAVDLHVPKPSKGFR